MRFTRMIGNRCFVTLLAALGAISPADADQTPKVELTVESIERRPQNLLEDAQEGTRLASQGYRYVDRVTGDSLRETGTCAFELVQHIPKIADAVTTLRFGCGIDPIIRVELAAQDKSVVTYAYTVANGPTARDNIALLKFPKFSDDVALAGDLPDGWRVAVQQDSVYLFPVASDSRGLAAETALKGGLTSTFLPSLAMATVYGITRDASPLLKRPIAPGMREILNQERSKVVQERLVVVPGIEPPGASGEKRKAAFRRLRTDAIEAKSEGWIDEESAKQLAVLIEDMENAGVPPEFNARLDALKCEEQYRTALRVTLEALVRR